MAENQANPYKNRQHVEAAITRIDQFLAATLPANVADSDFVQVCDGITQRAFRESAQGVVLDFNLVDILDTVAFTAYANLSRALKLCGAHSVWVGLRPAVICALFDLNVPLDDLPFLSATRLEDGLALLRDLADQPLDTVNDQAGELSDNNG